MLDKEKFEEYKRVRHTADPDIFCHAPFTSLYFEQSGHALVCCYNRTHILGVYPKDSLQDMWLGSKAQELRELMKVNKLPSGCDFCHSQFSSRNFGGLLARQFDGLADPPGSGSDSLTQIMPKVIGFEISNVCNLECKMCNGYFSSSIRENREKQPPLPFPYDDGFVTQLEPFIPYLKQAKFLGGEPFLIDLYYKIWEMIARINPSINVSITTNGTVLHKKAKSVLEGMRCHIIMSIDSIERSNYERIRRNARFDKVMEHFQYFREYTSRKNTSITFAFCPMQQNWWELPHIVDFCNKQNIGIYFNTVTWPPETALNQLNDSDLQEVVDYLETKTPKCDDDVSTSNVSRYLDLVSQIKSYRKDIAA
jgi:MoaA/NifB/PqqE/SkfB family radical SAM enzyme